MENREYIEKAEKKIIQSYEKVENVHGIRSVFSRFYEIFNNFVENLDIDKPEAFHIALYSEIVHKIRSSEILFENGYCFEGIGLLRSSFEINNALLGIRMKKIDFFMYNECLQKHGFLEPSEENRNVLKNELSLIKKPYKDWVKKKFDNILNNEEFRIYKEFEFGLNTSLHEGTLSYAISMHRIFDTKRQDGLFGPIYDEDGVTNFIVYSYAIIFMTLKNLKNENILLNAIKLNEIIKEIQKLFNGDENKSNENKQKELMLVIDKLF